MTALDSNGWNARAEREAVAIIAGTRHGCTTAGLGYDELVEVVALGWLQGAIFATHLDLSDLEQGFAKMQAEL